MLFSVKTKHLNWEIKTKFEINFTEAFGFNSIICAFPSVLCTYDGTRSENLL